ncbi:MAG: prepilin-type N-terminal cleavage/methylation domain-containing protein [Candidatus Parcubacteria bacterium]|nr:prepilin-type N-terminal cleavage/methylation domain-containing protein [Candidatus Parcubacteria bacterium]
MKGFTILEIIISLAIILILVIAIVFSFSSFRNNRELTNAAQETINLLNLARSKTLSSEGSSQYGIHFESSRIVLFRGTSFSESSPDNIVSALSSLLEISAINLNGGGNNLVFQRLTGKTDNYGIITLRIKSDIGKTKIIEIKKTGIVNAL